MAEAITKEQGSFRDPSGQVIVRNGEYLREIAPSYWPIYDGLMKSGLYQELTAFGLMIPHYTVFFDTEQRVIRPEQVQFISYPYEWPFSYLKEAALATLEINEIAMKHGMMLKDASAYNLQWVRGKMRLIDTLSFVPYEEGQMWYAYPQFLMHFLVPLLLMATRDTMLSQLQASFIEGVPLALAAKLLPSHLRLRRALWPIFYPPSIPLNSTKPIREARMRPLPLRALLWELTRTVQGINYRPSSTWSQQYKAGDGSYTMQGQASKHRIVQDMLRTFNERSLCDLGANTGEYSKLATGYVLAVDRDHDSVEMLARAPTLHALRCDLTNPTPAIGWGNTERKSFLDRLHVDTIMALALIHHVCIGNNVPLPMVAKLLSEHCQNLIIEFVPPDDPKAALLLGNRTVPPYSYGRFKEAFGQYFTIEHEEKIEDSLRTVFLMRR